MNYRRGNGNRWFSPRNRNPWKSGYRRYMAEPWRTQNPMHNERFRFENQHGYNVNYGQRFVNPNPVNFPAFTTPPPWNGIVLNDPNVVEERRNTNFNVKSVEIVPENINIIQPSEPPVIKAPASAKNDEQLVSSSNPGFIPIPVTSCVEERHPSKIQCTPKTRIGLKDKLLTELLKKSRTKINDILSNPQQSNKYQAAFNILSKEKRLSSYNELQSKYPRAEPPRGNSSLINPEDSIALDQLPSDLVDKIEDWLGLDGFDLLVGDECVSSEPISECLDSNLLQSSDNPVLPIEDSVECSSNEPELFDLALIKTENNSWLEESNLTEQITRIFSKTRSSDESSPSINKDDNLLLENSNKSDKNGSELFNASNGEQNMKEVSTNNIDGVTENTASNEDCIKVDENTACTALEDISTSLDPIQKPIDEPPDHQIKEANDSSEVLDKKIYKPRPKSKKRYERVPTPEKKNSEEIDSTKGTNSSTFDDLFPFQLTVNEDSVSELKLAEKENTHVSNNTLPTDFQCAKLQHSEESVQENTSNVLTKYNPCENSTQLTNADKDIIKQMYDIEKQIQDLQNKKMEIYDKFMIAASKLQVPPETVPECQPNKEMQTLEKCVQTSCEMNKKKTDNPASSSDCKSLQYHIEKNSADKDNKIRVRKPSIGKRKYRVGRRDPVKIPEKLITSAPQESSSRSETKSICNRRNTVKKVESKKLSNKNQKGSVKTVSKPEMAKLDSHVEEQSDVTHQSDCAETITNEQSVSVKKRNKNKSERETNAANSIEEIKIITQTQIDLIDNYVKEKSDEKSESKKITCDKTDVKTSNTRKTKRKSDTSVSPVVEIPSKKKNNTNALLDCKFVDTTDAKISTRSTRNTKKVPKTDSTIMQIIEDILENPCSSRKPKKTPDNSKDSPIMSNKMNKNKFVKKYKMKEFSIVLERLNFQPNIDKTNQTVVNQDIAKSRPAQDESTSDVKEIKIGHNPVLPSNHTHNLVVEENNLETISLRISFLQHKEPIIALCVHKSMILAASEDGCVYIYNKNSGCLENTLYKHFGAVTGIVVHQGAVYTIGLDGSLQYADIESCMQDRNGLHKLKILSELSGPAQALCISWNQIFIGTRTGHVDIYDLQKKELVNTLNAGESSILAMVCSNEGPRRILLVANKLKILSVRDAQTGLLLRDMIYPNQSPNISTNMLPAIYCLLLHKGEIYCGTSGTNIEIYNFTSGEHVSGWAGGRGTVCMILHRGLLFSGCYDGNVYAHRMKNGTLIGKMKGPGKMLLCICIIGDKIVAGTKDNALVLWNISDEIVKEMTNC